jgi:hypothetical protein
MNVSYLQEDYQIVYEIVVTEYIHIVISMEHE